MDISGLEDEYRLAEGKPKLIYIKSPAPNREPRLQEMLAHIRDHDGVSYKHFSTADELRELIEGDLALNTPPCPRGMVALLAFGRQPATRRRALDLRETGHWLYNARCGARISAITNGFSAGNGAIDEQSRTNPGAHRA